MFFAVLTVLTELSVRTEKLFLQFRTLEQVQVLRLLWLMVLDGIGP
jgi:hypothetical protein